MIKLQHLHPVIASPDAAGPPKEDGGKLGLLAKKIERLAIQSFSKTIIRQPVGRQHVFPRCHPSTGDPSPSSTVIGNRVTYPLNLHR